MTCNVKIEKLRKDGTLTWLHVSDIHFRDKDIDDQEFILNALAQNVEWCRTKGPVPNPDLLFITGDIAFSGLSKEYALAKSRLTKLTSAAGLVPNRVFLIPGNHDVDRKQVTLLSLLSLQDDLLGKASDKRLRSFFVDEEEKSDRNNLFKKHNAYLDFVKKNYPHCYPDGPACSYVTRIDLPTGLTPERIWVLGLNSAWLGRDGEDENRLLLGRTQILSALAAVGDNGNDPGNNLIIALTHHPVSWVADWDEELCRPLIDNHCDFHLRGHLHKAHLDLNGMIGPQRCSEIACGASYGGNQWHNGYNFVHLDFNTGKGLFFSQRYEPETAGWTADPTINKPASGQFEWALSERLQNKKKTVFVQHKLQGWPASIDARAFELMLDPENDEIDQRHRYTYIKIEATIDKERNYMGRYTFAGVNESKELSSNLIVPLVAVGAHEPDDFDVKAWDLNTEPPSAAPCKVFRSPSNVNKFKIWISIAPISQGEGFNTQVSFCLPKVMYRENDFDVIGLKRFSRGIKRFEYIVKTSYSPVTPCCYAIHPEGPRKLAALERKREVGLCVLRKEVKNPATLGLGFLFHYKRLDNL